MQRLDEYNVRQPHAPVGKKGAGVQCLVCHQAGRQAELVFLGETTFGEDFAYGLQQVVCLTCGFVGAKRMADAELALKKQELSSLQKM